MKIRTLLLLLATSTAAFAVDTPADKTSSPNNTATTAEAKTTVTKAVAVIHPTEGNKIKGTVVFTSVPGGIKIVADIDNLTPGKHGFHVHEFGDCSAHDGSSAGGHFNPTGKKHGGPDSTERHVGDFGNLDADKSGHAHYERIDKEIAFSGTNSILGKSIVIHADEDDLKSQPSGNSGARIGCGVVNPQ